MFLVYTECHRRNGPNFRRVFLMLNYTDITHNTYIQSWTVTEIMAREKCGHLAFPRTVRLQLCSALTLQSNAVRISVPAQAPPNAIRYFITADIHALCTVLGNPKDNHAMSASVFVVQFNGFMSLTSY